MLSNEASEESKRTFLDHAYVLGGSSSKCAAAEIGGGNKLPPVAVAVKVMRPGVREAMEFGGASLPANIEQRDCLLREAMPSHQTPELSVPPLFVCLNCRPPRDASRRLGSSASACLRVCCFEKEVRGQKIAGWTAGFAGFYDDVVLVKRRLQY